jgi:chromosome partitioning protein
MALSKCSVIAVTNQKGGVGKTTTSINLACALAVAGKRVLAIDSDPHGNLTQGLGLPIQDLIVTLRDLIMDRAVSTESAIIRNANGIDVIGANPLLAQTARWMVTKTNAELRLRQRIVGLRESYDFIVIDSCPGLGTLLNSTLNAADRLIIPVDPGFYGYMGIQELQKEIEDIREGTNPDLSLLGVVMTLSERTVIARETFDALIAQFGDQVFETQIRRSVALRESPALGQSVFRYAPKSHGAEDYSRLAFEVLERLGSVTVSAEEGVRHV